MGNPWLITDLITLGSPLAHAEVLVRAAGDSLAERQEAREYPRCPPLPDNWHRRPDQREPKRGDRALAYRSKPGQTRKMVPSAIFAFVHWTNLYFPGDVIGGPVAPVFGAGVRDIAVKGVPECSAFGRLASYSPLSHTKYWATCKAAEDRYGKAADAATPAEVIPALRAALALDTDATRALLKTWAAQRTG